MACVAAIAGCRGETAAPPQLEAMILRQADTVRFQTPVVLYRCDSSADFVIAGTSAGNGVLVWLRPRDSLTGDLPIVGVRDTVTRPAAVVAVRYDHESVLHALSLDSGSVLLRDSAGSRGVTLTGSGLDVAFGVRSGLAASFATLPPAADSTTSCSRIP